MSKNWIYFVTVMLLEDTPAVLSLGKLCEDHGKNYHWTNGQKPHIIKKLQEDQLQCGEQRTLRSIDKFFNLIFSYFSYIFVAGKRDSPEHPASTRSESMSEEVQGNLSHGTAETVNPNINDDNKKVRRNLSCGLPEWLQEFPERKFLVILRITKF